MPSYPNYKWDIFMGLLIKFPCGNNSSHKNRHQSGEQQSLAENKENQLFEIEHKRNEKRRSNILKSYKTVALL